MYTYVVRATFSAPGKPNSTDITQRMDMEHTVFHPAIRAETTRGAVEALLFELKERPLRERNLTDHSLVENFTEERIIALQIARAGTAAAADISGGAGQ